MNVPSVKPRSIRRSTGKTSFPPLIFNGMLNQILKMALGAETIRVLVMLVKLMSKSKAQEQKTENTPLPPPPEDEE
jgi:hypothetical protein